VGDRHRSRLARGATAILALAVLAGLVEPPPSALSSTLPARRAGSVVLSRQRPGRQLSFASLGSFKPAASEVFGEGTLSVNPRRPKVVAWCGEGYVSIQDGRSVLHLATAAALKAIARWLAGRAGAQYGTSCHQVALGPGPGQAFAAFVLWPDCDALRTPPVIDGSFGLYTDDYGRTWSFVPTPRGLSELSFGRFSYGRSGQVQASFSTEPGAPYEVTSDGGRHWSFVAAAATPCPSLGLCAYLASAPPSVVCLGFPGPWASLQVSLDAGGKWSSPFQVVGYQSFATLVVLAGGEALLVSGGGGSGAEAVAGTTAPNSPVMFTADRGRLWQAISVPPVPGHRLTDFGPSIAVLPDGDLLYVSPSPYGSSPGWQLLRRGSRAWCSVKEPPAWAVGASSSTFTVTDGEVWWLVGAKAKVASPASIVC